METANRVLDYYSGAAAMTRGGAPGRRLTGLPAQIGPLCERVQNLFLYDVVAKDFYGYDIPKYRLREIHVRSAANLLDKIFARSAAPLTEPRSLDKRVIGRCGHFVLLAVAALRAYRIPARARCGFGAYFNPPQFEDHWVCEYWDEAKGQWSFADVQFDSVWIDKLNIRHDVLDVPRDQFLVAAEAWKSCRAGTLDPARFGIEFAKFRGLWFIAGSLIRDLAALNKIEMLPWDSWGAQPQPNAELSAADLEFFDKLAELTETPDRTFDELRDRYASDDRVRVPQTVFNAIKNQTEAVGIQLDRPARDVAAASGTGRPAPH